MKPLTLFSAITVLLILLSCEAPARMNPNDLKSSEHQVEYSLSRISGSEIAGHESFIITFGELMDIESLSLSGTLGEAHVEWNGQDEVTLSPSAASELWSEGEDLSMILDIQSAEGIVLTGSFSYDVIYAVFVAVSHLNADDGNDGTVLQPLSTVQAGIDLADSLYDIGEVRVAAGLYTSDYNNTNGVPVVDMTEGISVYGGYNGDFSIRNPNDYITTLEDLSTEGGDAIGRDPNRVLQAIGAFSEDSVVNGFTLLIGSGETNAGLYIKGDEISSSDNSLQFSGNIIRGRSSDTAGISYSYGILVDSYSSPLLLNNDIDPGFSTEANVGIYTYEASPEISGNTISGGISTGETSAITVNTQRSPQIRNNILDCGEASSSVSGITIMNAYPFTDGGVIIDGNDFYNDCSTATIRTYIIEQFFLQDPGSVRNNRFDQNDTSIYYEGGDTTIDYTLGSFTDQITTIDDGTGYLSEWGNEVVNDLANL